jgi:hypothetical protein
MAVAGWLGRVLNAKWPPSLLLVKLQIARGVPGKQYEAMKPMRCDAGDFGCCQ